jgi:hypothetical protein
MISFCRFFAPLLLLLTMTVAQEAVNGDTGTTEDLLKDAGLSRCMNETSAIITCVSTQNFTNTTLDSVVSTQYQACLDGKQNTLVSTNEAEWVGKSCSKVQGSVDDAFVECAPDCQLDGCTKEITVLAGCAFVAKVNCTEDGKIQEAVNGTSITYLPTNLLSHVGRTECMTETNALIVCFTPQNVTNTTLIVSISDKCQACLDGKESTLATDADLISKSCSEVQGLVDTPWSSARQIANWTTVRRKSRHSWGAPLWQPSIALRMARPKRH